MGSRVFKLKLPEVIFLKYGTSIPCENPAVIERILPDPHPAETLFFRCGGYCSSDARIPPISLPTLGHGSQKGPFPVASAS